jgi:hypothetical protein
LHPPPLHPLPDLLAARAGFACIPARRHSLSN